MLPSDIPRRRTWKRLRSVRFPFEYALVRLILWLVDVTPLVVSTAVMRQCADLVFLAAQGRRRLTVDNILKSGLYTSHRDALRLTRESYRHFAVLVVESLKTTRLFEGDAWRERVEMQLPDQMEQDLKDGQRGLVLASGHFGNWEVAAQVFSRFKPVAGITRKMANPHVERLVQQRKPRERFRLIPKREALPTRFLDVLKGGEALAFMIDQHAGDRGMIVDFFGRPASTHMAVAMLPLITGTPLYFGTCVRTGPMRYRLRAVGPVPCERTGNREADVRAILERLNQELETAVRETPEQFLWGHRRWRTVDLERAGSRSTTDG
jgi:KDO2-lipid IV(A) lauroyltransferase